MNLPEIGDIWKWYISDDNVWTVILLEDKTRDVWECLCLEDGEISEWWFGKAEMPHWSKLA